MDITAKFNTLDSKSRIDLLKNILGGLSSHETMVAKKILLQSSKGQFDILISVQEDVARQILSYFCLGELTILMSVSRGWRELIYHSGIIHAKKLKILGTEYEEGLAVAYSTAIDLYKKEQNWRIGKTSTTTLLNFGHGQRTTIKSFTLKGPYLLVGYGNQRVQVLDTSNNIVTPKLSKMMNVPIYSDICPISKVAALIFFCRECVVVDIETSNTVYRTKSSTGPISCVSISGDFLVIGKCSGFLEVYNWRASRKLLCSSISTQEIKAACIFPSTSLIFSVAYDSEIKIYNLIKMKLEQIYSDNLGYAHGAITNKLAIGIWKRVSNTIQQLTKEYCMTLKFSSVVFRYFFSIKKDCQISLQSQEFMNVSPLGCYQVHPFRAIGPLNMAKDTVSIFNFASPEFRDKKSVEFDYRSALNISGQSCVTASACNSELLALGLSSGEIGFCWFNNI